MTHICVSKLTIIGSDNGLSPGQRQAIIWTNARILLIRPSGTNFSEILIEIHKFSFKKMHFKTSSVKWRPFCFGLNVLSDILIVHICSISTHAIILSSILHNIIWSIKYVELCNFRTLCYFYECLVLSLKVDIYKVKLFMSGTWQWYMAFCMTGCE